MLGSTVIVFREVLEAALIITILLAATRGRGLDYEYRLAVMNRNAR